MARWRRRGKPQISQITQILRRGYPVSDWGVWCPLHVRFNYGVGRPRAPIHQSDLICVICEICGLPLLLLNLLNLLNLLGG
jgi:hypothetical protein